MSLELDARQRAMLREMGVRLWLPSPAPAEAAARQAPAPAVATPAATVHPTAVPVAKVLPRTAPVPERPAAPAPTTPTTPTAAPGLTPRPEGIDTMDWPALQSAVTGCRACRLCEGRTQTVFGVGSTGADWMVVGEAPGEQEDRQGEPFVGPAGQLLDRMLAAIGRSRQALDNPELIADRAGGASAGGQNVIQTAPPRSVYIANVLKCRPPGNRNPQPDEIAQCEPYLRRQVALVQPKVILAMGRFAVQSLLATTEPIGRLRGRVHHYAGVPVIVTYHPAYLLRAPQDKAKAWQDLCLALATLQPGAGEAARS